MTCWKYLPVALYVFGLGTALAQDNPFLSSQPGYPDWSPFTGMKWENDRPIVLVDDEWYQLHSIHGVTIDEIIAECEKNRWPVRKRIQEDLVQIIRVMGLKIDRVTDLELIDDEGVVVTKKSVPMTVEKLKQLNLRAISAENPFFSGVPGYPDWSPFNRSKLEGDRVMVEVDNRWYQLISIHGIDATALIKACDDNNWQRRRITSDLVQLIRLMGHDIDKTTDLELKDDSGNLVKKVQVKMVSRRRGAAVRAPIGRLGATQMREDLAVLRKSLETQFSYLNANHVDLGPALNEIVRAHPKGIERPDFHREIQKIMSMFIDGHARTGWTPAASGYLPFLVMPSGDRLVAVKPDRTGLVDANFPYVHSIDGTPIDRWLEATTPYYPKGSPQYTRHAGLRLLRWLNHFRQELGKDLNAEVVVKLEGVDSNSMREITMPVSESRPIYGLWPPREPARILDGNIGYMRLESMSNEAVETIRMWMPKFRDTRGLIVDVRGNGGGIRTPILELAPYLLTADDEPRIANVAKYRLAKQFGDDHLSAARFVYRADSSRFSARDRDAVKEFAATFAPEWDPPAADFSGWHYMVLSKNPDDKRYHYRGPVAILMDEGCFSATDIFLGAFKGWPNITLIGQSSGGGSARTQSFQLPKSNIRVACASMASFQPTGYLYDTNGIKPDITVTRPPSYYVNGGEDVVLKRALKVLTSE